MSRRLRPTLALVILVSAVCFVLGSASVALAASAIWSDHAPPPDMTIGDSQPTVSVHVEGALGFDRWWSATLKVDGKTLRHVRIDFDRTPTGGIDYTKATVSADPVHWKLADGSHVVEASILDNGAVRHRENWTFGVGTPLSVAPLEPQPNSIVTTVTPLIKATTTGAVTSGTVTVDGQPVPATLAAGVISAQVASPLADESAHTVRVVARNAEGDSVQREWTFEVQTRPKMALVQKCDACHTGYPTAHPVDDCAACHGEGSPWPTGYSDPADSHAPGTRCSSCHGKLSDCGMCHGKPYATVPVLHSFAEDTYHDSTTTGCQPCHSGRLAIEHNRTGLTCTTCHTSANPDVTAAISSGDTGCGACHASAGEHEAVHDQTIDPDCDGCHQGNLVTEHVANRDLTCDTCHDSADSKVQTAIEAGDLTCGACHDNVSEGHEPVHEQVIATGCTACHSGNLVTEHVTNRAISCGACHDSADETIQTAIATGDGSCSACHDMNEHPYPEEAHQASVGNTMASGTLVNSAGTPYTYYDGTPATYANQPCGQCHLMDLLAEHTKPTSSVSADSCEACHESPRDSFATWGKTCSQGDCHPTYHADMPTKHFQDYQGQEQSCGRGTSSCHPGEWSNDLAVIHDQAWYYGGVFADISAYTNGCRLCHVSPNHVPPAQTRCNGCHTGRHGAATYP